MGPIVRHSCYRCGGSCQGPGNPVEDDERDRLIARGAALGVGDPVRDGRLRTIGGRCVFLQEDNLCALQLAHGPDAKPRACRTWPFVQRDVGGRIVAGVDPGCLTATLSADAGPVVGTSDPWPADPVRDRLEGPLSQAWARLLGSTASPGRPPLSEIPWMDAHLDDLLDAALHPRNPPGLRARLRHLAGLRGVRQGAWRADPAMDAHALHVARAMVGLGLIPGRDPVHVARDVLRGAALCAWADPGLPRFAPALAAWSRLQRAPELLAVLDRP